MDSSFLTFANIGLGLFSSLFFLKMIIQFGLPNHPGRFISYLVVLCVAFYFTGHAAVALNFISPWKWVNLQALPLVTGSLALLLQTVMMIGHFSVIQQKVVSRIPLMAGLICLAIFPMHANIFFVLTVVAGCIFLSVSVGKARYQKRLYFKMTFFVSLFLVFRWSQEYHLYLTGQFLLFFVIYYLFLFQQAFSVAALIDEGVFE